MATQVFLGNPSNRVVTWIKRSQQQQFATIVNNTHLPTAQWPESQEPWPQNIALSGSSVSYRIQPGQTKNIKPGTYRTIVTNKQHYDKNGTHYNGGAWDVHINVNNIDNGNLDANGLSFISYGYDGISDFTLNYDDGTSEYFESSSYTYEGDYVYNVNTNYEFTYGQKNL